MNAAVQAALCIHLQCPLIQVFVLKWIMRKSVRGGGLKAWKVHSSLLSYRKKFEYFFLHEASLDIVLSRQRIRLRECAG